MPVNVTYGGVTLNFDSDVHMQQTAAGDYELEGAVTVLSSSLPFHDGQGRFTNGIQLNVDNTSLQGFDSYTPSDMTYDPSLNVRVGDDPSPPDPAFPYREVPFTASPGDRIFCAVSMASPLSGGRPAMERVVVFTVVDQLSPPGSFRAPYSRLPTAPTANISDIDWSRVESRPLIGGDASPLDFDLPTFMNYNTQWTARFVQVPEMFYGRTISRRIGKILCALAMDYPQHEKEQLMYQIIQFAIDVKGVLDVPGIGGAMGDYDYFYNNGAHNHGRLMAMLFAGWVLHDDTLYNPNLLNYFQEIQQTFIVGPEHVPPYDPSMIGLVDWDIRTDQAGEDPSVTSSYRDQNGVGNVANGMAMRLHNIPGFEDSYEISPDPANPDHAWNETRIFASGWKRYLDVIDPVNGAVHEVDDWVKALANTYYDDYNPSTTQEPNMQTMAGQVIWAGGDAGEDQSIPQSNVDGDLGSIFNVDADGNWTIEYDGDHPTLQALNVGDEYTFTFTITNADGETTVDVRGIVQGTDDVPTVDPASVTTVTQAET